MTEGDLFNLVTIQREFPKDVSFFLARDYGLGWIEASKLKKVIEARLSSADADNPSKNDMLILANLNEYVYLNDLEKGLAHLHNERSKSVPHMHAWLTYQQSVAHRLDPNVAFANPPEPLLSILNASTAAIEPGTVWDLSGVGDPSDAIRTLIFDQAQQKLEQVKSLAEEATPILTTITQLKPEAEAKATNAQTAFVEAFEQGGKEELDVYLRNCRKLVDQVTSLFGAEAYTGTKLELVIRNVATINGVLSQIVLEGLTSSVLADKVLTIISIINSQVFDGIKLNLERMLKEDGEYRDKANEIWEAIKVFFEVKEDNGNELLLQDWREKNSSLGVLHKKAKVYDDAKRRFDGQDYRYELERLYSGNAVLKAIFEHIKKTNPRITYDDLMAQVQSYWNATKEFLSSAVPQVDDVSSIAEALKHYNTEKKEFEYNQANYPEEMAAIAARKNELLALLIP